MFDLILLSGLLLDRDDLAGYPPAHEVNRLPPADVCMDNWLFACEHFRWVQGRLNDELSLHRREEWLAWLREANARREFWNEADNARRCRGGRLSLAKCRDIIGPEAWYGGYWPPAVPIWRFQVVR